MNISKRSGRSGIIVALAVSALLAGPTTALSETALTVNGIDIDSSVVDMYLESRIQKPAEQATAEEREVVIQELTDIYLLTTQPSATALKADPRIKAQIELQGRAVLAQAVATEFFTSNAATDEEILAALEGEFRDEPEFSPMADYQSAMAEEFGET